MSGKAYRQSAKFKATVRERDGNRCQLCGCTTGDTCNLHWAQVSQLDVAHIIPWKDGGATTLTNVRLLCHACNVRERYGGAGTPVTSAGRYLR